MAARRPVSPTNSMRHLRRTVTSAPTRRLLAAFSCLAVSTTFLQSTSNTPATADSRPARSAPTLVTERRDRVSAMAAAVAQGSRVEDLSARTPSSGLFANSDGSWTLESFAGVVRSESEPDTWVAVDPSLSATADGFEPAAVPFDVEFADGGTRKIAAVSSPDGAEFSVRAPSTLRDPASDENQVRYETSAPGDLVVTSMPNGFNFSVELDAAPATGAEPLEYRFPLSVSEGRFVERRDGAFDIVSDGEVVASMSVPLMWDSADEPVPVPVAAALEGTGSDRTLVLRPDAQYLADPERVYPVTVDPTVVLTATGDTWVQSLLNTSSQYTSPELRVGTNNLGLAKARSYVNFDVSAVESGAEVVDAEVAMTNFAAGSCSGSQIRLSRVTSAWSLTDVTWGTQPTTTTTGASATDTAFGATACSGEGVVAFDATQIAQAWVDGTANHGVQFKADQEGQNASWRKYQSLENGDTAKAPKLTITYNQRPATPTSVTAAPGTGGWSRSQGPEISAVVTDPDGGQVASYVEIRDGSSTVWSGTSTLVPSGGTATVTVPAGTLSEGQDYVIWAFGEDDLGLRSQDKAWKFIKVDTVAPTVAITSNTFTNDDWTTAVPSSSTLTLTGSSDTAGFYFTYNGVTATVAANSSGVGTVTYTPAAGWHTMSVVPVDHAGNAGDAETFQYGTGSGSFTSPTMWAPSTSSFPIDVSAPPSATSADLQWRRYGETTWRTAQKVDLPNGTSWTGTVTQLTGRSTTGDLVWNATEEPDGTGTLKAPGLLEIRSCFDYTGGSQSCTDKLYVGLHVTAFGDRRPVAELGPAQVALTSGEALIVETDAVDSKAGLGRSFSSLSDGTLGTGVFGPGWSDAQLLAPQEDAAASVIDNRSVDGTFVILDADGGSQVFKPATAGSNTYEPAQPTGDRTSLTLSPGVGGAPDTLELSRPLGADVIATTWEWSASDTGGDDGWVLKSTDAPGTANDLAVTADHQRPTWIRESDPTAASACTSTTQTLGCRGLKITYTGTGAATRVSEVHKVIGAESPASPASDLLASYNYSGGNLTEVCSAAPATGEAPLCSEYTYTTAAGRTMLATMKPAGLTEWRFSYDSLGRLATVKREKPGGGDAVWSIDYNLTTTSTGLPDMSASKVAEWGQQVVPSKVYAVYQPHAGTTDVTKAGLFYTTASGVTTNTATYGPAGWLVDTSWYDTRGNQVQHLDATGWARVQDAPAANRPNIALEASSFSVYNTWGDSDTVGTRVVDEYGPAHTAVLEDGTSGYYRAHTSFMYDDDPNVEPALIANRPGTEDLGLVVKETTSTATADRTVDHDQKVTKYGYAAIVSGDADGWELGVPTATWVKIDGNSRATATMRYDIDGHLIETRQPGGGEDATGAGNDAHSTVTTYYTADGAGDCGGRPAWEGLVCTQGPAVQPVGATIPVTHYVTYNAELRPTLVKESSGSVVNRTITTDYDNLGRTTVATTETGGTGVAADSIVTTYEYASATGLPTTVTSSGETVTTDYDSWGREVGYTDAAGNAATTTYDAAGRIATSDDGAITGTHTYDDYGYLLSVTLDGGVGTFEYDLRPTGEVAEIAYPNGLVATYRADEIGTPTGVTYVAGGTALAFTAGTDARGRTVTQTSPESAQEFSYDGAGRLVNVEDRRSGSCTTRSYGFSLASERTSRSSYGPAADGSCQTATVTESVASTFDAASRITNSGYSYDALGRTVSVPSGDTADGGSGALAATYRANDMVRTLTQDVANGASATTLEHTYALDPLGRIDLIVNTADGNEVSRSEYRYGNSSDSPTSIRTSVDAGANWTTTTYSLVPRLGMAASSTAGSVEYQIVNPHGDIVAAADSAGLIGSYVETDEYGNQIHGATGRYGWLGSHQRSTDAVGGLMLMGARAYNPATGTFTTPDAVVGGNATPYVYPADPVNDQDLTGLYSYSFHYWLTWKPWVSAATVASRLVRYFGLIFPIPSNCGSLWLGRVCRLAGAGPVKVIGLWSTGFTFMSMPGHVEGPYKTITFYLSRSYGNHHLGVRADGANTTRCQRSTSCRRANYAAAYATWQYLAFRLRWWI